MPVFCRGPWCGTGSPRKCGWKRCRRCRQDRRWCGRFLKSGCRPGPTGRVFPMAASSSFSEAASMRQWARTCRLCIWAFEKILVRANRRSWSAAGGGHPVSDGPGGFGGHLSGQVPVRHGRYLDMDVHAIQQGAGDFGPVAPDLLARALAGVLGIGKIAAGTRVHGCHRHEACRVGKGGGGPGKWSPGGPPGVGAALPGRVSCTRAVRLRKARRCGPGSPRRAGGCGRRR